MPTQSRDPKATDEVAVDPREWNRDLDSLDPFPGLGLTDEMAAAVSIEERTVPGPEGAPDVRVLLYRPKAAEGTLPLVVSLHGGGFALRPDNFPLVDARFAMLGALVMAVDYRI